MINYVRESWMRGFTYEDYTIFCNRSRGMIVSEYSYNKWCAYYNYLMHKDLQGECHEFIQYY